MLRISQLRDHHFEKAKSLLLQKDSDEDTLRISESCLLDDNNLFWRNTREEGQQRGLRVPRFLMSELLSLLHSVMSSRFL